MSSLKLSRLNVSLTKHGAHKIALLLRKHSKDEVLGRADGKEPGINIDVAQARKNLSVGPGDRVPAVWNRVRPLGPSAIDALVLIAIIFSHHDLMAAMARGRAGPFRGRVLRGEVLDGKAFTNLKHTLVELGFSLTEAVDEVTFDLRPLFGITGLAPLALEVLKLKLRDAGWDESTDAIDEMVGNGFNESLAVTPPQFESWLRTGDASAASGASKDAKFFAGEDEDEGVVPGAFVFKPGHNPRKTGTVPVAASPAERRAQLRHNELQTALHAQLVKQYGEKRVGTEVATGLGTSLDAVVCQGKKYWFYEIKIANSLRACLRQAIPQLLEYAYWRCDDSMIERLIVVGTFRITPAADAYLGYLRKRFGIPIYYEQFTG